MRMMASPYQPRYQNQYWSGVNTKNDQKSVRWSARVVLMRLTYSRRESSETNANNSMEPAGPITNEMENIPIMIHQARMRAFRLSMAVLPSSDFTRRESMKPMKLASTSPPITTLRTRNIW